MKNGLLITMGIAAWAVIKGVAKLFKALLTVLTNLVIFFGLYIPLFYVVFGVILLAATDFSFGGMGTDQILYFVGLGLCGAASLIISIRNVFVRPISFVFAPIVDYFRDVRAEKDARRAEEDRDYGRDPYGREDLPPYRDPYGREEVPPYRDPYDREPPRYAARDRYYDRDPYAEGGDSYAPRGYAPEYSRDPYRREEERADYPPQDYYREEPRDYARDPYRDEQSVRAHQDYPEERPAAPAYVDSPYPRFDVRPPREPEAERPLIYYSRRRPGILVKEYSDRFELYREDMNGREYVGTEYKDE